VRNGLAATPPKGKLDSLGIEFVSRREGVATGGPMGRLFVTIISAIAELERSLVVERVKSGMRRAKLEGRQIGRARLDIDRAGCHRPPFWAVADSGRQAPQHFESLCMPPDERGERELQSRHPNSQRKSWVRGSDLGRHDRWQSNSELRGLHPHRAARQSVCCGRSERSQVSYLRTSFHEARRF